jgi:nondiscriminating aspartyl-tRNA synthetase
MVVSNRNNVRNLKLETAVEIRGKAVVNAKAPGGVEVLADRIEVMGKTYYELLPFSINQKKIEASLEVQLDNRTVSLRRPDRRAVFKIQEEIVEAFRKYLRGYGFSEIHTPKIVASGTEGGSEVFTVNYFDTRAFLAQSPQFYKQMMVGAGFEAVYEIGHAYRAELHNTWRHLNEYVSLDVEMGFIEDENDLMDLEEGFLQFLIEHLKGTCAGELELLQVILPEIREIPRIPLLDAQDILLEKYNKKYIGGNIDSEGEVLFAQYVKEEYGSDFVFLTRYPVSKRPMYAMPDESHAGLTRSFDLLFKGLEITTGGQRIHDYEMLRNNLIKFGINPDDFAFYLDTFKYVCCPMEDLQSDWSELPCSFSTWATSGKQCCFPGT